MLLRNDVSSIPDSVAFTTHLSSYEIASGGGYTAGGNGTPMGELGRVQDSATGTVEYTPGTNQWQSSATLTIASFRWIVAAAYGTPIAIWDLGVDTALSAEPLNVVLAPSPYITGSFPIMRFRRNLA